MEFLQHFLWVIPTMTFYLTYTLTFYLAFYLTSILILSLSLTFFQAFYLTSLLTFHLTYCARNWSPAIKFDLALIVGVQQSALRSGPRSWGPVVPAEILRSRLGCSHWDLALAVDVRCPLRSGTRGWGPDIWSLVDSSGTSRMRSGSAHWYLRSSRLRSGSSHWDLELAVDAWQCALRSGSRSSGPAVFIEIWSSRLRSGSAHCCLELEVEELEEEEGRRRK